MVLHDKSQLKVVVVGIGGHSRQQKNSLIAVIEPVMMLQSGYKTQSLLTRAAQRHQGRFWSWIFPVEVLLKPAEGQQSHFTCGTSFQGFTVLVASLSSQIPGNNVKQSTCGRLINTVPGVWPSQLEPSVLEVTCRSWVCSTGQDVENTTGCYKASRRKMLFLLLII